jgi:hypothetical protein
MRYRPERLMSVAILALSSFQTDFGLHTNVYPKGRGVVQSGREVHQSPTFRANIKNAQCYVLSSKTRYFSAEMVLSCITYIYIHAPACVLYIEERNKRNFTPLDANDRVVRM